MLQHGSSPHINNTTPVGSLHPLVLPLVTPTEPPGLSLHQQFLLRRCRCTDRDSLVQFNSLFYRDMQKTLMKDVLDNNPVLVWLESSVFRLRIRTYQRTHKLIWQVVILILCDNLSDEQETYIWNCAVKWVLVLKTEAMPTESKDRLKQSVTNWLNWKKHSSISRLPK